MEEWKRDMQWEVQVSNEAATALLFSAFLIKTSWVINFYEFLISWLHDKTYTMSVHVIVQTSLDDLYVMDNSVWYVYTISQSLFTLKCKLGKTNTTT